MSTAGESTSSFGRFSAVISDLPDHMTIKDLKIHFLHKANGGDGSPVDLSVVASFESQRVLDNVTRRGHYYRGEEFTVEPLSDELRSKRSEIGNSGSHAHDLQSQVSCPTKQTAKNTQQSPQLTQNVYQTPLPPQSSHFLFQQNQMLSMPGPLMNNFPNLKLGYPLFQSAPLIPVAPQLNLHLPEKSPSFPGTNQRLGVVSGCPIEQRHKESGQLTASRETPSRKPPSHDPYSRGPPSCGPPSRGTPSHGPTSHRPPPRGPPSRGPPSLGPPSRGPPSLGPPSLGPPSRGPPSLGAIGGHLSRNAGMAPGDSPSRGPYNIDQRSPYDSYDEESEQDPEEQHVPTHRNPSRFMNIHMKKHAFDITDSLTLHVYSMDILRASVDAIVCFTNQDLSKGPILNYITNTEGRVLWNELDQYIAHRPGCALRAGEVASFPVKKFRFSHVVFVYLGEEIDVTAIHTCLVKLLKLVDQRGWESLAVPLRTYYTEDEGDELTGEDFTWALYTHLRKKYSNKEDYTLKTVHLVSKHTPKIKEIQSYLTEQIYYKY